MSNYSITPSYVLIITGETVDQDLIDAAEGIVEEYARRTWTQDNTVTDALYSGDGKSVLMLRSYPIVSVSAISIYDDGAEEWDAFTAGELTDLKYDKRIGEIIYENGVFEKGFENIKISYIYSWTDGIPARAKTAIARVAAYLRANPLNASSERIGDITIAHGGMDGILKQVPRRVRV